MNVTTQRRQLLGAAAADHTRTWCAQTWSADGVECRPERVKKKDARPTGKDADVERRGRFRERRAAVAAVVREADGAANSPYWCPEVTLRIADSFRGVKRRSKYSKK